MSTPIRMLVRKLLKYKKTAISKLEDGQILDVSVNCALYVLMSKTQSATKVTLFEKHYSRKQRKPLTNHKYIQYQTDSCLIREMSQNFRYV